MMQPCFCARLQWWIVVTLLATPLAAFSVDEVKLKNGQTLRGQLLQYDERGIALRLDSGRVLSYPTSRVEKVGAILSEPHQFAEQALDERRYSEAVEQFRRAQQRESRQWALSRIDSGLVRALSSAGQFAEAGEAFLNISERRTDAEVMAMAPLVWQSEQKPRPEAIRQARQWLHDDRPVARLLGASWLLQTTDGEAAEKVLDQLATDPEQRVSWLARAQLWRLPKEQDADEIARFRALIDKMPEPIRAGPQFMLGLAYQRANQPVDAALAFLWVPFTYAPETDLAAEATLLAAEASLQAGMGSDAEKLFREVIEKHPETSWAVTAKERLEQAAKPPAERN